MLDVRKLTSVSVRSQLESLQQTRGQLLQVLEQSSSTHKQLTSQLQQRQAQLEDAKTSWEQTKVQLDQTQVQLLQSKTQLEQTRIQTSRLQAQLEQVCAELTQTKNQVSELQQQLRESEKTVEASRDCLLVKVDFFLILQPISGKVGRVW